MTEHHALSGFSLEPIYDGSSVADGLEERLGRPGSFPYTRGVYPTMYRGRPWTIREYAGFGSPNEANARFRDLIMQGNAGLSVAFDLPTQMGYDSDHPMAAGEVGRVGVAIDSVEDMRLLFDQIPLGEISTSMTINSPAAVLLLAYQLVAEEQGVDVTRLEGTIQNDVLKEYIARGTYIFPPAASMRLTTDVFRYCKDELPRWNTISISGYHIGEAGASPVQELAFTIADAIEYVSAALRAGLEIDEFAPRLSFFFVARTQFLEEIAKFRAARRIWATIMRDTFGAKDPQSLRLRFHTQTAGVQLTAQQPEVNLVRVTLSALGAILGGTQSLHTNAFDEAIALPTEKAARLALRTQQVLMHETDLVDIADPFGGSYAIEALTDTVESETLQLLAKIAALGGAVAAIEQGFQKAEIERSAYATTLAEESGERVVVGVNSFLIDEEEHYEMLRIDPAAERSQIHRLKQLRASRDANAVAAALEDLALAARGDANVCYPIKEALRSKATVGEVCDTLRAVWGTYEPTSAF
jgi:methylmalonyl-CoA mutase N-terminal domain/subunit